MTIKNYASDMLFCFILSWKIILLANQSSQNGRISSMDFHRLSNYLVTASDDESIRLYDVANATYDSSLIFISFFSFFFLLHVFLYIIYLNQIWDGIILFYILWTNYLWVLKFFAIIAPKNLYLYMKMGFNLFMKNFKSK